MGTAGMVLPDNPIPLAAVLATLLVPPWEPGDQSPLTLHSIAYPTMRYRTAPSKGGCGASSHRHLGFLIGSFFLIRNIEHVYGRRTENIESHKEEQQTLL